MKNMVKKKKREADVNDLVAILLEEAQEALDVVSGRRMSGKGEENREKCRRLQQKNRHVFAYTSLTRYPKTKHQTPKTRVQLYKHASSQWGTMKEDSPCIVHLHSIA